jgi:hypothetical protein
VILGHSPLIVLKGLLKKDHRAWFGSLTVGIALIIWIIVEILMIGYFAEPPLQLIYGVIGIMIVIVTSLPYLKSYYLN